jgi:hypothetical protein
MSHSFWRTAFVRLAFGCVAAASTYQSVAAPPDLIINRRLLARSLEVQMRTFAAGECAVVEGCTVPGERKLLLFDASIANIGAGNLVIGNPALRTNLFHFSECHGHYHLKGFSSYALLNQSGTAVRRARKQGFCLRDDAPYFADHPPARGFDCDNQGITRGWQDIYDKSLDCQFLDITGVKAGRYLLRVTVNPNRVLRESNYDNNSATVPVTIQN